MINNVFYQLMVAGKQLALVINEVGQATWNACRECCRQEIRNKEVNTFVITPRKVSVRPHDDKSIISR
jgi:hypothetical protein